MAHASRRLAALLLVLTTFTGARVALAAGACDAFKWDVRHERALFAARAEPQKAGGTVGSAPVISLDKLYRLQLPPLAASDFTGAHGCSSPRKVVLYRLEPGDLLLQVSGWAAAQVELTVTRAPHDASVLHR